MKIGAKALGALGAAGVLSVVTLTGPVLAQEDVPDPEAALEDGRPDRHGEFLDALASELGIDAEELKAAAERVKTARFAAHLRARVSAGDLTEDEAREIFEARRDGTLHERMRERRIERVEERLRALVESGDLTEDEARERLERIRERAQDGERPFRRPGRGRFGPGRGFGDRGAGGPTGPGAGVDARLGVDLDVS